MPTVTDTMRGPKPAKRCGTKNKMLVSAAEVMRERFGAREARSCQLRFHAQTAGSTLTAQQPLNNMVRVAIQALAATLGGTQSLHTNGYDEALALPTAEAATLALRTQQIVAHESGVTNIVDPLGGSYFVEKLTDDMADAAMAYFDHIDAMGGMVSAIEQGFPQREIADSAYRFQQAVERRDVPAHRALGVPCGNVEARRSRRGQGRHFRSDGFR